MVAENSIVCLCLGMALRMNSMSSMNPMSSILSASSRTRVLMSDRFRAFLVTMSLTRPGVPTTMSHPLLSFASCFSMLAPPYMGMQTWPVYFDSLVSSPETWLASSLVGTSTMADGVTVPEGMVPMIMVP